MSRIVLIRLATLQMINSGYERERAALQYGSRLSDLRKFFNNA